MTDTTVVERLAVFAAGLTGQELPEAVAQRAKACLVHALVVGAAGSVAEFGRRAERTSVGWPEKPARTGFARSLLSGNWHPSEAAAFINGVHLHARAQEDTHGTFHPGVCVIPAALATGEAEGADGATVLAAVVAGYEVGTALSVTMTELTTPPFRATAVFGPIAAAATAGRIRGFDADTMAHALAIAASLSGGTAESFGAGTDEWHFQSGNAAAVGMRAAQLAEAGVTGSRTAIESPSGFADCFAGRPDAHVSVEHLGSTWNILDVTFKPYPVCAFNQTPAMLAVRLRRAGLRPQDVTAVHLRMNEREATYPGMPAQPPFTSTANTLMSARFAFAAGLVLGDISYATLCDFTNPDILQTVSKIELLPEPGRRAKTAHARVVLSDGSTRIDAIDNSDALLSWTFDEVVANAGRLAAEAGWTAAELLTLIDAVTSIEHAESVDSLVTAVLASAAQPA
ncbi:MmgE/PrpD family protein [Mycolicibacterium goodii]|uniref:MmgE/PrpD family protein n=1 Tax=Mycolicibacterium goodii TaxID=134601 RepID=UPI001BDD863D|nr:MmgE/PrpD family protein [Mycolicibacterium goodii]MBU8811851.1 MmgE/PrpD family protein [Mycolicibacterium goodii]